MRENSHQQVKISHGDQLQMCLSITQSVWERMKREFIHLVGCVWRRLQRAKEKKIRNLLLLRSTERKEQVVFVLLHQSCVWNNKWKWHERKTFFFITFRRKETSHCEKRKENRTHVAEWWTQFKNELELLFIFRVCLHTLLVFFIAG